MRLANGGGLTYAQTFSRLGANRARRPGEALKAPLSADRGVPRRSERTRSVTIVDHRQFRHDEIRRVPEPSAFSREQIIAQRLPEMRALPPVHAEPGGYVGRGPGEERTYRLPRRRLKAARLACGLTQFQLAMATGLTNTAIGNLESGRTRYPRLVTMERLAVALGVELDWLRNE